jgi:hypothetical protein
MTEAETALQMAARHVAEQEARIRAGEMRNLLDDMRDHLERLQQSRGARQPYRVLSGVGGTSSLVTYLHFTHSYAINPGSPTTGRIVTTSLSSAPQRGHEGAAPLFPLRSSDIGDPLK